MAKYDRIEAEWRIEEPGGSVYRQERKLKRGTEVRWIAQFRSTDHTGRRRDYRDTKSRTKRAAQKALVELKKRAYEAKFPPKNQLANQTTREYLERWHSHRVETEVIRATTAHDEARYIETISDYIGDQPLRELRGEAVEYMIDRLEKELHKGHARTMQRIYGTLRKALNDVRPALDPNPLRLVRKPTPPKQSAVQAFTEAELKLILHAVDQPAPDDSIADPTFGALIHLLASTGLRIGEGLGLIWDDVDLDAARIRVRATLIRLSGKLPARGEPKTPAAKRTIPISGDLVDRLRRLPEWNYGGVMPHDLRQRPVFVSDRGTWLHDSNLAVRDWHPLLKRLGLPTSGFHKLRHTFASIVLNKGLDPATVSRLMGHADPAITLSTYAHFIEGREEEAAEIMGAVSAAE